VNRPGLYKLAGVLLIVVPVCCGLVAIGAALAYSVRLPASAVVQPTNPYIITRSYRPPTAAQPAQSSPTEARPAPPQAPAPAASPVPSIPTAQAMTFEKLNSQGEVDFILVSPDMDPNQIEAKARDLCDRTRGDFCYMLIWSDRAQAARAIPMTDAQINFPGSPIQAQQEHRL
jgi:hypothetical protein